MESLINSWNIPAVQYSEAFLFMFLSRPTTFYESFFHYYGCKNGNFIIVEYVHISCTKEISSARIRDAVIRVCSSHAVWNSVIDTSDPTIWKWGCRSNSESFISVQQVEGTGTTSRDLSVLEDAVKSTISKNAMHIIRENNMTIYYVETDSSNEKFEYELSFIHSHATMDGASFLHLLKEVLYELSSDTSNLNTPIAPEIVVSEYELIDFLAKQPKNVYVSPQGSATPNLHGINKMLPIDQIQEQEQRKPKMLRKSVPLAEIYKKCKEEGTTVQAAVVAAIGHAQAKIISSSTYTPLRIKINTPVNLRSLAKACSYPSDVSASCGLMIGIPMLHLDISESSDIWESARSYKTKLNQNIHSGGILEMSMKGREWVEPGEGTLDQIFEFISPLGDEGGERVTNLNVSNIGMLDDMFQEIEERGIELTSIYGGSWSLAWGDCLYVLVASLKGTLHISFVYCSLYDDKTMESIAEETLRLLLQ